MEDDHWGIGSAQEHDESPLAYIRAFSNSPNPYLSQAAVTYTGITDFLGLEQATGASAPTAYFASIVSSLDQKGRHTPESLGGLAYLLSRIYPMVPPAVLCARSDETAELLLSLLRKHADIAFLTKNLLHCIAGQLRAMPAAMLVSKSRIRLLQGLLVFVIDPRPKVRRLAQRLAAGVFRHLYELGPGVTKPDSEAADDDDDDEDAALRALLRARGLPLFTRAGIPKPCLDTLVRFCVAELSACSQKDCQAALYLCGALQHIVAFLPVTVCAQIFAELLRLAAEGNVYLAIQTFRVMSRTFSHGFRTLRALAPEAYAAALAAGSSAPAGTPIAAALQLAPADVAQRLSRAGEFITQLMASAADIVPPSRDAAGTLAYLDFVKAAFASLAQIAPTQAVAHAPKYVAALAELMATAAAGDKTVAEAAAVAAKVVVKAGSHPAAAVAPAVAQLARASALRDEAAAKGPGKAGKAARDAADAAAAAALELPFALLVVQVQSLLGLETQRIWPQVLSVIETLITTAASRGDAAGTTALARAVAEATGADPVAAAAAATETAPVTPAAAPFFEGLLQTVDGLVTSSHESGSRALGAAAERCVATAIKALGPEYVLSVLPLELPVNSEDDPRAMSERIDAARAWLLPLLSANVRGAALSTFTLQLLPLADDMLAMAAQALSARPPRAVEAKALFALGEQLWQTLPAFARLPTDIPTGWKPLAKRAAAALMSSELAFAHPVVCRALRALIVDNLALAKGVSEEKALQKSVAAAAAAAAAADGDDAFESDDEDTTPATAAPAKAKARKQQQQGKKTGADDDSDDDDDDADDADHLGDATASFIAAAAASGGASSAATNAFRPISRAQAEANVAAIGAMGKNFLPLLFNAASTADDDERVVILNAVAAFAVAAPVEVRAGLFRQAMEKYVEATTATTEAHREALDDEEGAGSGSDGSDEDEDEDDDEEEEEEEQSGSKGNKRMPAWRKAALARKVKRAARARRHTPEQLTSLSDTARALADIIASLVPSLDSECLLLLLRAVTPHLSSADPKLQRKSYQLVAHVIGAVQTAPLASAQMVSVASTAPAGSFQAFSAARKQSAAPEQLSARDARSQFVAQTWQQCLSALMEASANVLPASVRGRVVCAKRVFTAIPDLLSHPQVGETLPSLLGEAILATKESNARTREASFDFVMATAREILKVSDPAADDVAAVAAVTAGPRSLITEFTYMILAGLAASTPLMKSATVTMLARLLYEFRAVKHEAHLRAQQHMSDDGAALAGARGLPQALLSEVLATVTVLLQSRAREILKAVLGFIKVACMSLAPSHLMPQLGPMLQSVAAWPADVKSRFKGKVRTLYTVLIKKLGVDSVRAATPATDARLVEYLRREMDRDARKKAEAIKARRQEARTAAKGKRGAAAAARDDDEDAGKMGAGMSFEEFLAGDGGDSDGEDDGDDVRGLSAAQKLEREISGKKTSKKAGKRDGDEVWIGDSADLLGADVHRHIATKNPAFAARLAARGAAGASGAAFTKEGKLDFAAMESAAEAAAEARASAKLQAKLASTAKALKRSHEDRAAERKVREDAAFEAAKPTGLGREYASAKSGGDGRKKGMKLDPFAYVPLDPRTMNKRASATTQAALFKDSFQKSTKKAGQTLSRSQRQKKRREHFVASLERYKK
jgi:ribosomal RNA-processing protein 12